MPWWHRLFGLACAVGTGLLLPSLGGPWLLLAMLTGLFFPELRRIVEDVAYGDAKLTTPWGPFQNEVANRAAEHGALKVLETAQQRHLELDRDDDRSVDA